jgi:hypothetical protein
MRGPGRGWVKSLPRTNVSNYIVRPFSAPLLTLIWDVLSRDYMLKTRDRYGYEEFKLASKGSAVM